MEDDKDDEEESDQCETGGNMCAADGRDRSPPPSRLSEDRRESGTDDVNVNSRELSPKMLGLLESKNGE